MQAKPLRPYQADASEAIIAKWKAHRTLLCVLATGGGKTLVAAATADKIRHQGKVLYLANRNELCQQPLSVFFNQTGILPALEKAEHKASLEARLVIGSVQTMTRKARLDRFPVDHFGFIFADEAHGAVSDSWKRIFEHFPHAKICGITATPFRSDNKKLSDIFEDEAYRLGLFQLVDQGYLVSPDHVDRLDTAISLANVRVKRGIDGVDFDLQDAHDAIVPYFDSIARELKERHSDKHILAFLPLIASSEKFVASCRKAGLNAVHIDGMDPDRDAKLQAFKDGHITLLANSNLLHTGVDIPACDCTLNLRPTKSKVLYQQVIGRSTRTVPGLIDGISDPELRLAAIAKSAKPRSYIIDPLWLSSDHDLVTPSMLVAENTEMAAAIQKRGGKSYSLREVNKRIEKEREEAILRRLQTNAARFRAGKVPKEYFTAGTRDRELAHYEPVYRWETLPIGYTNKRLLAARGIDPATVKTEGEAQAIIRAINRRRYLGLAEMGELARAVETGMDPDQLWNLTAAQAQRI